MSIRGAHPRRFRAFLVLWVTQSISIVGDYVTYFALTIWLTEVRFPRPEDRPELGFALSAITIGSAVVAIACATPFGVLVDRYDRRRLMQIGNVLNAGLSATLAVLASTDRLSLWVLLPLVWLAEGVAELHQLSFEASYLAIVDESRLTRANGMMSASLSAAEVIAPTLALGMIALAKSTNGVGGVIERLGGHLAGGTAFVFAADAASFLLAALGVTLIRFPSPHRQADDVSSKPGMLRETLAGARFLIEQRPLLVMISMWTVVNFADAVAMVLLPMIVKFNLAADWSGRGWSFERALAVVSTSAGVAGVAGGVLISVWGGLRRRIALGFAVPMMIRTGLLVVLGLSTTVWIAAAVWGLTALIIPITRAHAQVIWLTRTPAAMQGRVQSVRMLVGAGSIPLGAAIGGWLGGRFDPGVVVAVIAGAATLVTIVQTLSPTLHRVEALPVQTASAMD